MIDLQYCLQQVTYKVMEAPPNVKGGTASASFKPVVLDCGATVQVPMFIEAGENIIIQTEDSKYIGRA